MTGTTAVPGPEPVDLAQAAGKREQPPPGKGRQWMGAALAVAAVGWGAQQFAPLLVMYEALLGVSNTTIQSTFGFYVVGLLPGLLLGGPLSDRLGRRRVVYTALVTSLAGSVLLIFGDATSVPLFAGRLVAGVASGAAFSAGATWIKELSDPLPDGTNPAPRRVTIAMSVGFGLGPLVAGILAQWAPAPTVTIYLPHLALAVAAVAVLGRVGETASRRWAPRRRLGLAGLGGKRFLFLVVPMAPWVFGSASIALAYMPSQVTSSLGGYALIYSAVVTMLTSAAGIAVQPLARRIDHPSRPRLLAVALTLVLAGAVVAAAAAATRSPGLVVVAALVLGGGYGSCQVCGLLEVQRMTPTSHLARATAIYQATSYIGFVAPFPLAALGRTIPVPLLLLMVAGLALLTLIVTLVGSRFPAPTIVADTPISGGSRPAARDDHDPDEVGPENPSTTTTTDGRHRLDGHARGHHAAPVEDDVS